MNKPNPQQIEAFIIGFSISDECFNAEHQFHYNFKEIYDYYISGELNKFITEHNWEKPAIFIEEILDYE